MTEGQHQHISNSNNSQSGSQTQSALNQIVSSDVPARGSGPGPPSHALYQPRYSRSFTIFDISLSIAISADCIINVPYLSIPNMIWTLAQYGLLILFRIFDIADDQFGENGKNRNRNLIGHGWLRQVAHGFWLSMLVSTIAGSLIWTMCYISEPVAAGVVESQTQENVRRLLLDHSVSSTVDTITSLRSNDNQVPYEVVNDSNIHVQSESDSIPNYDDANANFKQYHNSNLNLNLQLFSSNETSNFESVRVVLILALSWFTVLWRACKIGGVTESCADDQDDGSDIVANSSTRNLSSSNIIMSSGRSSEHVMTVNDNNRVSLGNNEPQSDSLSLPQPGNNLTSNFNLNFQQQDQVNLNQPRNSDSSASLPSQTGGFGPLSFDDFEGDWPGSNENSTSSINFQNLDLNLNHQNQISIASPLITLPKPISYLDISQMRGQSYLNCAVCFEPIYAGRESNDSDKLRIIPGCGHVYHSRCVDEWIKKKKKCPCCMGVVKFG